MRFNCFATAFDTLFSDSGSAVLSGLEVVGCDSEGLSEDVGGGGGGGGAPLRPLLPGWLSRSSWLPLLRRVELLKDQVCV